MIYDIDDESDGRRYHRGPCSPDDVSAAVHDSIRIAGIEKSEILETTGKSHFNTEMIRFPREYHRGYFIFSDSYFELLSGLEAEGDC